MGEDYHDFFVASAGVAGALIGLLFVAISASRERLSGRHAQLRRIQTSAALTSFINSLLVSLFGLIPGLDISSTLVVVASIGLAFVVGAALSLMRVEGWRRLVSRNALFIAGLAAVFSFQLRAGLQLQSAGDDDVRATVAVLVIVCFLVGIAHAYELIGGPSIDLKHELAARLHPRWRPDDDTGRSGDRREGDDPGAAPPSS